MSARSSKWSVAHPDELLTGLIPYAVFAVLFVWLGYLAPASYDTSQLTGNVDVTIVLVLVGVGQTFVIMTGGIDLSVGGLVSAVNAFAAAHMAHAGQAWTLTAIIFALGWVPGLINGFLVAYAGLQPFIVTLATWFVWGGIAFYFLPSTGGLIAPSLGDLAIGEPLGISSSVWMLLIVAVFASWFLRTRAGLQILAVGSNEESARQRGVPTRRVILMAYGLSSFFAVAAGLLLSAQSLSGDPTVGDSYILLSVAAAVVGGTSLFGGRGSAVGTIVGAFILTYIVNVVFALGIPSQWSLIFSGGLLVASASFQLVIRRVFARRGVIADA